MKKNRRIPLYRSCLYLLFFIGWTVAVLRLDVLPIGPEGSSVGMARLNCSFHRLTGVHMSLYLITDWLSLLPVFIMMYFAAIGLFQWIRRRRLLNVDRDILLLGAFYLIVFAAYLIFEEYPVNYRPVLINGVLEASYPSSTTLLVLTVIPSTITQIHRRVNRTAARKALSGTLLFFAILMTAGRLVSGVHWLTDIIGAVMLSAALAEAYAFWGAAVCAYQTRNP